MNKAEAIKVIRQSVQKRGSRPAAEQLAEMVARGAIDAEGRVIVRSPKAVSSFSPKTKSPQRKAVDG